MKPMNRKMVVSEWEESISFDVDDPDFCNALVRDDDDEEDVDEEDDLLPELSTLRIVEEEIDHHFHHAKVNATMSLASVQAPHVTEFTPIGRSSISVSSSISDLMDSSLDLSGHADTMLTIEDLRAQMGTCFTCGVSWSDDHVSLDCSECGGYSLSRPCPLCDGACGELWKRDFSMSHAFNKARWVGVCPKVQTNILVQPPQLLNATNSNSNAGNQVSCGTTQRLLAQELRARLEQLQS